MPGWAIEPLWTTFKNGPYAFIFGISDLARGKYKNESACYSDNSHDVYYIVCCNRYVKKLRSRFSSECRLELSLVWVWGGGTGVILYINNTSLFEKLCTYVVYTYRYLFNYRDVQYTCVLCCICLMSFDIHRAPVLENNLFWHLHEK